MGLMQGPDMLQVCPACQAATLSQYAASLIISVWGKLAQWLPGLLHQRHCQAQLLLQHSFQNKVTAQQT